MKKWIALLLSMLMALLLCSAAAETAADLEMQYAAVSAEIAQLEAQLAELKQQQEALLVRKLIAEGGVVVRPMSSNTRATRQAVFSAWATVWGAMNSP